MGEPSQNILPVNIEDELKKSYLDYAMSVIVGRALPDARDGLKPVHRRVLFAMSQLNNDWNKSYKKSARVVGDVIGKYHPHGDTAVYDTIVRMAQPFSLRYMLVDGQGNFGSIDGDNPAAMRYTEVRMSKVSHEILSDLNKETVDWVQNYDETEKIPVVMPTRIPNLLVNGSSGIAVGMATNIPPHNLREVIKACLALISNPEMDIEEIIKIIPGPDFPTAGIINGKDGIENAYRTGRGSIFIRARTHFEKIEKSNNRQQIIVSEIPYQINKTRLIEKISELVKNKKIEGISALRDESDKDGMRIVIELRKDEIAEVVLNNLYTHTQLQSVFGINIVALVNNQPRILNLKELLESFISHRREVVTRRTVFELRKAHDRAHILEGQAVALSNVKTVVELIERSSTSSEAKNSLIKRAWESQTSKEMLSNSKKPLSVNSEYFLSPLQASAILDLRLNKLTSLEHDNLLTEYQEMKDKIDQLNLILKNRQHLMDVVRREIQDIYDEYGDKRKTEIIDTKVNLTLADMIPERECVVTISHSGYAKTQTLGSYEAQHRGGKGKLATGVRDQDYITHLLTTSSHTTLLLFSSKGKVYWLKTYDIPEASRFARGRPLVNLLPLELNEKITAVLPITSYRPDYFIFMATAMGTVKKTSLEAFKKPRSSGLIALELTKGDVLIKAVITDGNSEIMLFSNAGKTIRFKELEVRPISRTARGVRGMRLLQDQKVVSMLTPSMNHEILTVSARGYGKQTALDDFPIHKRGGRGVTAITNSNRNGLLVGTLQVCKHEEIILISDKGTLVRTRIKEIPILGRSTQGVSLIRMPSNETLVGIDNCLEDTKPQYIKDVQ